MSNTYTYYQTDRPNILGGYNTYDTFQQALEACEGGWGTAIYVCTLVRADNNLGIKVVGALSKLLWRSLIWKKK